MRYESYASEVTCSIWSICWLPGSTAHTHACIRTQRCRYTDKVMRIWVTTALILALLVLSILLPTPPTRQELTVHTHTHIHTRTHAHTSTSTQTRSTSRIPSQNLLKFNSNQIQLILILVPPAAAPLIRFDLKGMLRAALCMLDDWRSSSSSSLW